MCPAAESRPFSYEQGESPAHLSPTGSGGWRGVRVLKSASRRCRVRRAEKRLRLPCGNPAMPAELRSRCRPSSSWSDPSDAAWPCGGAVRSLRDAHAVPHRDTARLCAHGGDDPSSVAEGDYSLLQRQGKLRRQAELHAGQTLKSARRSREPKCLCAEAPLRDHASRA